MRVGILTVGSLYWESSAVRQEWRRERLVVDASVLVKVPIRYGRRSSSRGDSFTMVFDRNLKHEDYGQAIVLPCRRRVHELEDLVEEAKRLWAAERNSSTLGPIAANWGCVALLRNPAHRMMDSILAGWKEHVSTEKHYGNLSVDERGRLRVLWPNTTSGSGLEFDALLATSTEPTLDDGKYSSAAAIAHAWTTPKGERYGNYFSENKANEITTFQDAKIEKYLYQLSCK